MLNRYFIKYIKLINHQKLVLKIYFTYFASSELYTNLSLCLDALYGKVIDWAHLCRLLVCEWMEWIFHIAIWWHHHHIRFIYIIWVHLCTDWFYLRTILTLRLRAINSWVLWLENLDQTNPRCSHSTCAIWVRMMPCTDDDGVALIIIIGKPLRKVWYVPTHKHSHRFCFAID